MSAQRNIYPAEKTPETRVRLEEGMNPSLPLAEIARLHGPLGRRPARNVKPCYATEPERKAAPPVEIGRRYASKYGPPPLDVELNLITRYYRLAKRGAIKYAAYCSNGHISVHLRSELWQPLDMITWDAFREMIERAEEVEGVQRKPVGRPAGRETRSQSA